MIEYSLTRDTKEKFKYFNKKNCMNCKTKIIDNFFNIDDFDIINNIKLDVIRNNSIKMYHNTIDKKNIIQSEAAKSCISENIIQLIHKKYHQKVFKILEELNLKKSKLYDYTDLTIIKTGKNYKFPIHDDTPNKLLSGVIYLYPKINTGTIFYENKKGNIKETILWKKNRAVFFSREERETWHSYEGDGKSDRIALVYNLMTNRIKDVYKIEKKNYLLGNFRQKINPYIFKYFHTII